MITRVSKQEQSGLERPHRAYRRNDDDQELLSLELFHRAHLNVRQAHLPEKDPNLLTLKRNQVEHVTVEGGGVNLLYLKQSSSNLFPVWGNNANIRHGHRFVELLGQLAAVQHDLNSLHRVEPRRVVAFPHFCALKQTRAGSLCLGVFLSSTQRSPTLTP